MPKDTLKNRIRISTTLTPETQKLLKDFSEESQVPITRIIESAIIEYVTKKRGE